MKGKAYNRTPYNTVPQPELYQGGVGDNLTHMGNLGHSLFPAKDQRRH